MSKLENASASEAKEEARRNLTAAEARKLANESHALENEIYKLIRQQASDNRISIRYTASHVSVSALANVVGRLTNDGYIVRFAVYNEDKEDEELVTSEDLKSSTVNADFQTLVISW